MDSVELIDKVLGCTSAIIRQEKAKQSDNDKIEQITYGQYKILDAITKEESPTITSLARRLDITKPSMTFHIQNLEKKHLVYRERAEHDKRITYISLTDLAKNIENAEKRSFRKMSEIIGKQLSVEEEKSFYYLLEKIIQ